MPRSGYVVRVIGKTNSETVCDIAVAQDFAARYGEGVHRGLSLGGGGLFFIAWQTAYLHKLASEGLRVDSADCVVGTSAGSLVASALLGGRLRRIHTEMSLLARYSKIFSRLMPNPTLQPSQQRALDLMSGARNNDIATLRAIGHAALGANVPSSKAMRRSVNVMVGVKRWPSKALKITCVDAFTGERCVVSTETNASVRDAIAASCSIPGFSSPQAIGDRLCMDGGVSGTFVHLDLLAGARKVLVLALSDGMEEMPTIAPGAAKKELELLAASGTEVMLRVPEHFENDDLLSPEAVPKALAMGTRQASADLSELVAFWS
jgi:NTE family protein